MNLIMILAFMTLLVSQSSGGAFGEGCGTRKYGQNLEQNSFAPGSWVPSVVVRGHNAVRGSLPWQIFLRIPTHPYDHLKGHSNCGGTIIDKKWILTAAHCLICDSCPPDMIHSVNESAKIIAGSYNRKHPDNGEQMIDVEKAFVHPRYQERSKHDNDIVLLKLTQDIEFNDYAQPACLPSLANKKKNYASGNWVIISGWGRTNDYVAPSYAKWRADHKATRILQVAMVKLVPDAFCKKAWSKCKDCKILDSMVCAAGAAGIGTCHGDSGGPVVMKVNGKFTILGIVSWGPQESCENTTTPPHVLTKVVTKVKWIKDTIARN